MVDPGVLVGYGSGFSSRFGSGSGFFSRFGSESGQLHPGSATLARGIKGIFQAEKFICYVIVGLLNFQRHCDFKIGLDRGVYSTYIHTHTLLYTSRYAYNYKTVHKHTKHKETLTHTNRHLHTKKRKTNTNGYNTNIHLQKCTF